MILAIDMGSTLLKAGLITFDGNLLAACKYPVSFTTASWITGLKTVFAYFGGYHKQITAIAAGGNGPTLVPVDHNGDALGDPIPWTVQTDAEIHNAVAALAGNTVDSRYYLDKIYTLFKKQPALYAQTAWFLPCPEYINFLLTGNACTIRYCEGAERYLWTDAALDAAGLDKKQLAPFIAPGMILGKVTQTASRTLGIPSNIPVVSCGTDFLMALIGTAAIKPGRVCDRAGTSEGVNVCLAQPLNNPRLKIMPHIRPGYYNASGIIPAAGKKLEQIKHNTPYADCSYATLLKQVAEIKAHPDNPFFLPGTGSAGEFAGLKPGHTALHKIRAVLESTGFAIREVLDAIETSTGALHTITVCGSLSALAGWNQLRADLLGKQIQQLQISDAELAGAACLALAALGEFRNWEEAAMQLVQTRHVFVPDTEQHLTYNKLYARYQSEV